IMIASQDPDTIDDNRFSYAQVIGIFHARASIISQNKAPEPIQFLWVRWFVHDTSYRFGWEARRLPRVEFMPSDHPDTFTFLDPDDVVRGVHLIPAFFHGRTKELLPRSVARYDEEDEEDWRYYYVNWFVDRDMRMRYSDDAVGH
ncbi:hypothetical protein GGX14DRAFT_312666, partial [Mycena pura]